MIVLDDDDLYQLVDFIVGNAIAHYGQPIPNDLDDDDGGYWSLRCRDEARCLTKDEAVERIIGHIIAGDRQDLLDGLADIDDLFKTMLAACPLESEPATRELVRTVVKDVVARTYCETPKDDGNWMKTSERGDDS